MLHVGRRAPIPSEKALTRAAAPFATVIAARYLGLFPLAQIRDRVRPLVRPHSKRGCPRFSRDASVQGATRAPICCTCHSLGLDLLEWNCAVVLFFVLAAASCFPVRLPRWVRASTDLGRLRLTDLRPMLPANARNNQSLERNAPSNDRVLAVANGVTNNPGGVQMMDNPVDLDLEGLAGSVPVTNFILAVGNSSGTCKWSVNSIQVAYTIIEGSGLAAWAESYGLTGDAALPNADTIDQDGYDNLAEFALGMNPTNSDAGSKDSSKSATPSPARSPPRHQQTRKRPRQSRSRQQ